MNQRRALHPGPWILLSLLAPAGVAASAPACTSAEQGAASPADAGAEGAADAGGPRLSMLDVTSAGDAGGVTLTPPFDPEIFDYYVRCAPGANDLAVYVEAPAGALARVSSPTTSAAARKQTVSVTAGEGDAVVATVTQGSASTVYWVRCLPSAFPRLSWTTPAGAAAPTPGYYLLANIVPSPAGYAMILDRNGVPVWYLASSGQSAFFDLQTLAAGQLSYVSFDPSGVGMTGTYQVRDLATKSTTALAPSGVSTDIHELQRLPSGDYLVLATPTTTGVDLTGLTQTLPDGGTQALGPGGTIQDCQVVELSPSGQVTWTWLASEHFDAAKVTTWSGGAGPGGSSAALDVFHCNSIDVEPATGDLLVSGFQMDSVFYVQRSSGKVLWKMGGADSSKDGATYVPVADAFHGQHDARFQPGWSSSCAGGRGSISLFDDEAGRSRAARAALYDVVVGEADAGTSGCDGGASTAAGATLAWQAPGLSSVSAMGSFRVLSDGSRVIGWGATTGGNAAGGPGDGGAFPPPGDGGAFPPPGDGGAFPPPGDGGFGLPGQASGASSDGGAQDVFTEVDDAGAPLLHFTFGTSINYSYRVIKVPLGALDLAVLRATAGAP